MQFFQPWEISEVPNPQWVLNQYLTIIHIYMYFCFPAGYIMSVINYPLNKNREWKLLTWVLSNTGSTREKGDLIGR